MKKKADLVIVGAGIVGCSLAYFLTRKGWKNIVVLEQGAPFNPGGSTSHAPGLVFEYNSSKTMCQLAQWSVGTYRELELDSQPCFYSVGSLELATSQERWDDLKNKYGRALSWGLKSELIDEQSAQTLFPLIHKENVLGALYVPEDGIAKALRACEAMGKEAMKEACEFNFHTRVLGFEKTSGRYNTVLTSQGKIETDHVVLCGGIWGPQLGNMLGMPAPLVPVQHQYVKTGPLKELLHETREVVFPILRHQDKSMYFRQHGDSLGIGSYFHEPLVVNPSDVASPDETNKQPASLKFTADHFEKAFFEASKIIPALSKAQISECFNGMFSFTPDGNPLLGEMTGLPGIYLAEAVWVTHAAGVAKVLAEILSAETPSVDLRELDANRFWDHCFSPSYIEQRGAQQYREVYDIIHPLQQMENPRPLRCSPFYQRQKELGAVFFETAGWERPQWYEANQTLESEKNWPTRDSWSAKYWSPIVGKEHKACREKVALFDLTAFTKLEVQGPDALRFLQYLSTNQIDQPVGKIVYTSMLNKEGGIVCDLTITRMSEDKFWVITGGAVGRHDKAWIMQNLSSDYDVHIEDITSAYCSLGLWGPQARNLLQRLCRENLSNESFRFYTAQSLYIDCIPSVALRLSYAGELGWEIYTRSEYGLALWDKLWTEGKSFGLVASGAAAFDSLRLEKGYRLWGADIHTEYDPIEAGLGFVVKMEKGHFLGKEALQEKIQSRRLCSLAMNDPQVILMGKEPVFYEDKILGYVTSANYGYTLHKSLAYAYLPLELSKTGTELEVQYFAKRYKAWVL